jgi:7-carboxy-7-deazaguanine synthase
MLQQMRQLIGDTLVRRDELGAGLHRGFDQLLVLGITKPEYRYMRGLFVGLEFLDDPDEIAGAKDEIGDDHHRLLLAYDPGQFHGGLRRGDAIAEVGQPVYNLASGEELFVEDDGEGLRHGRGGWERGPTNASGARKNEPLEPARPGCYRGRVPETLVVNEVYLSLQGESTFAGLPCVFVRLTACNLRCSYCDTAYAFTQGKKRTLAEIRDEVHRLAEPYLRLDRAHFPPVVNAGDASAQHKLPLVEFTGGEPLLQPNAARLMSTLADDCFTVLVETSGAHDISKLDSRIRRIMDLKCPSSGESARNRLENIGYLRATDEVKFVIGAREDYEWAKNMILQHRLDQICPLLFSWVAPLADHQRDKSLKPVPKGMTPISRRELVEAMVADHVPARFQLQMHKFIWPPDERGV